MAFAQFQLEHAITAFEQALQFLHTLARDDDLALGAATGTQGCFAQG